MQDHVVSGLSRAGTQHMIPHGLLTRAWLRSLTGSRTGSESAQSDLDEAWEIAERGPMPLFLADIHLYRARLFFDEAMTFKMGSGLLLKVTRNATSDGLDMTVTFKSRPDPILKVGADRYLTPFRRSVMCAVFTIVEPVIVGSV
jgi:hypothetical protein